MELLFQIGIWILACGAFLGVILLFWSFAGVITQVKWKKILIVSIMVIVSLFIYFSTNPPSGVVYMKEDVLYIKPAPKK